jgi:phosphoglucosamine mutase
VPRIFGTDGVRGLANGQLTGELALGLGQAAARVLAVFDEYGGQRPCAVVGRDTRISGEFLQHAVIAGLLSAGVDVYDLGVLPTPGVAHLTDTLGADVGVVISASHNPMPDNGIKFLARGGVKLADEVEQEIEDHLDTTWERPTGGAVGRVMTYHSAVDDYAAHLVRTLEKPLAGLTVVLDCAHGAASAVGPKSFIDAGALVIPIGAEPDGLNINDGYGSTHLERLQQTVVEHGADAGFAVDGDADRCLAVDHTGRVVDGDQIMAILAIGLAETGHLPDRTLVATVMSNQGLANAMDAADITMKRTGVGDRYVLEEMRAGGHRIGGEQSGHVILREYATTGDGLLTALHLMQRMVTSGEPLQQLAGVVTRLPQVLINVSGVDRGRWDDPELLAAVSAEEAGLGTAGRVLLRPSGTEPLVRVMVEAGSAEEAQAVAGRLADVVKARLTL